MSLIRRFAISSARSSPRGFDPAPDALAAIVDPVEAHSSAGRQGEPIRYRRRPFVERAGSYHLAGGRVLSLPRGSTLPDHDAEARRIRILDRLFRPVGMGASHPDVASTLRLALRHRTPCARTGRAVLLGGYYTDCDNYFHYWVDVVADIFFLRQLGHDLSDFDTYLMPFSGAPWQAEILDICGIDARRIMPFSSFTMLRARELVFGVRAKGGYLNPPWLAEAVRAISGWEPIRTAGRRIYLSRRDAVRRPISNEDEVIDTVRAHGFEVYNCSSLAVRAQQALFGSASHIVGPHGAAFTNLVWCNPGASVLEFLPREHGNPCFHDLATIVGLQYDAIDCPQSATEPALQAGYSVPIPVLQKRLIAMMDKGADP